MLAELLFDAFEIERVEASTDVDNSPSSARSRRPASPARGCCAVPNFAPGRSTISSAIRSFARTSRTHNRAIRHCRVRAVLLASATVNPGLNKARPRSAWARFDERARSTNDDRHDRRPDRPHRPSRPTGVAIGSVPFVLSIALNIDTLAAVVATLLARDALRGPAVSIGSLQGTALLLLVVTLPVLAVSMILVGRGFGRQ